MDTDIYDGFQDYNDEEQIAKNVASYREDPYKRWRMNQVISPETMGYAEIMKQKEQGTFQVIARNKRNRSWDMPDSTLKRQRSRWDETPATMGSLNPVGRIDLATLTPGAINTHGAMNLEQYNLFRHGIDIEDRNLLLTDEQLDTMLPGFEILKPLASYVLIRTPARKLLDTSTPLGKPLYSIPEEYRGQMFDVPKEMSGGFPFLKSQDYQYFGAMLNEDDEEELSPDEKKERRIMKLLLKVKNGTPQQRKTTLRHLTNKAREFSAEPLFNSILPLLMQPTLEDQERHLLVKVIDRVLYKLDELVRPYVHKILVVIEPILIDEEYCPCIYPEGP
ncbi:splicing factor 3B subunit 1 [Tanacetum coccineum]